MNEKTIPRWQRELKDFLGIKSGLILEGNVYDEYPIFRQSDTGITYRTTSNMDQVILNLVDRNTTEVIFFDPVDGFYSDEDLIDKQRTILSAIMEGYSFREAYKDHDTTLCLMPTSKSSNGKTSDEIEQYIWASEIIRRAMIDFSNYRPQNNKEDNENNQVPEKNNVVFVLNFASRLEMCNVRESESNTMFLNLMAATTSSQAASAMGNSLIMVVDKYNDVPAWVYLNNPNIRNISVCVPDRNMRRVFLSSLVGSLSIYRTLGATDAEDASNVEIEAGKQFIAETEGLKLREIRQILRLAARKSIKPVEISEAVKLYKYGVPDNPWEDADIQQRVEKTLNDRVKGQEEARNKVMNIVKRSVKGLSGLQHSGSSHKPKGVLFFAGPTGVGKTETAKALAEGVFGDENSCIRFDMSEYRQEHSDQKLFGAPPGYVGYEGGGQLTNAVKSRPFSVILFDEIEKAAPTILDKFLQILEDGRMTDNQGDTVYFGETIIIFTSNIGLTKEDPSEEGLFRRTVRRVPTIEIKDPTVEDSEDFQNSVTDILTNGVKDYFNNIGRPELLNRLGDDNIVVFQFINKKEAEVICDYKLSKICRTIEKERKIIIHTEAAIEFLHSKAVLERKNGGRGVGNMLEREFINPFAEFLCSLEELPNELKCFESAAKIRFEVVE